MAELQLMEPDFAALLQQIAGHYGLNINNNLLQLDSKCGRGYMMAMNLPIGISVFISDTIMTTEFSIDRIDCDERYFILQFIEEIKDDTNAELKLKKNLEDLKCAINLSHSQLPETYIFPASKRLRSVKILFNKEQLHSLIGTEALELLTTRFFPAILETKLELPISSDHRPSLDDLWSDLSGQCLMLNYIQNRILLLLEKYICQIYLKSDLQNAKAKKSEDETVRLMKVESLLVKDFASISPTLMDLVKISHMSPTKLKNDFKKLYGLPIHQYYQKNRMHKAHALLITGKYTVQNVSRMVGYINCSHFARAFEKQYGYLPSKVTAKDSVLIYEN